MGLFLKNKPKVLVSVLNLGWIRPELASVIEMMRIDTRVTVDVLYSNKRPAETNRNALAKLAVTKNYDYLIVIDHDTIPLKNPIDLVLLKLDVVGFAVPQWDISDPSFPIYFVGMDKVSDGYKEHKNKKGLQEVDAVGSACLVLSKKVLQSVKSPFVRKWNEDGIAITGLDFYFCEKAKENGFKVYCHYGYIADHIKEVSLLDILEFKHS